MKGQRDRRATSLLETEPKVHVAWVRNITLLVPQKSRVSCHPPDSGSPSLTQGPSSPTRKQRRGCLNLQGRGRCPDFARRPVQLRWQPLRVHTGYCGDPDV